MTETHLQIATDALASGDLKSAEAAARVAVGLATPHPKAFLVLGLTLLAGGRRLEAFDAFEAALAIDPSDSDVAIALAQTASELDMKDVALALREHVLGKRPDNIDAHLAYCDALLAVDRIDAADEHMQKIGGSVFENPDVLRMRGRIAHLNWRLDAAQVLLEASLSQRPDDPRTLYELAWVFADEGNWAAALDVADRALLGPAAAPVLAGLRFLRCTILLGMGRLTEGWAAFEGRLDPALPQAPEFFVGLPRWDRTSPLAGRKILLVAEQGLGDEILFLSLLDDAIGAVGPNGEISLCLDLRLTHLVLRQWPDLTVVGHETDALNGRRRRRPASATSADCYALLGDLLGFFRPNLQSFPARRGYLRPDPIQLARWADWLSGLPTGLPVGLAWRSGKMVAARSRNFAALEDWAPMSRLSGVQYVSLQYGATPDELAAFSSVLGRPLHVPPELDFFNDLDGLAALALALPLSIGFSNASTNIVGAVGAPLWMITPPAPWTALGSPDYPWYPQVRRFERHGAGSWYDTLADVSEALSAECFAKG